MKGSPVFTGLTNLLLVLVCWPGSVQATIVVESGSLAGFVAGVEPAAAYDNWVSHVSENIARPGYNAYAPESLDPQLNGFGQFALLGTSTEDQLLLERWGALFAALLNDQGQVADSLNSIHMQVDYELVDFLDTDTGRNYWIMREILDPQWTDPGLSASPDDDVSGGFRRSWGLYVFSPQATRPEVVVQIPHPCDDYITPHVGLDVFLDYDAGLLMINGAGREVLHTGTTFTNSRSLSDPTRNCNHPFAVCHEEIVAHWQAAGVDELVLQIHSYDDVSHRNLKSMVVTGGRYTRMYLPPLYDPGFGTLGALGNLPQPVVGPSVLGFTHDEMRLQDYMSGNPLYPLVVEPLPDSSLTLASSPTLWGYNGNCMMTATFGSGGNGYPECDSPERLLHIELDELPLPAHPIGESDFYYADSSVAQQSNFSRAWIFYRPFFDALKTARDSLSSFTGEVAAPTATLDFRVTDVRSTEIDLRWTPARSSAFDSYEILADSSGMLTPLALVFNKQDYTDLCWAPANRVTLKNLEYRKNWALVIRGVGLNGLASQNSDTVYVTTDDTVPPTISALFSAWSRFWTADSLVSPRFRLRDTEHAVDLNSLQVRVDLNADGSYQIPAEDWVSAGLSGSSADTTVELDLIFDQGADSMRFEFRVHDDQSQLFTHSGFSADSGISDDWFGSLDSSAPAAFSALMQIDEDGQGGLDLSWGSVSQDSTFESVVLHFSNQSMSVPDEAQWTIDRSQDAELALVDRDRVHLDSLYWASGEIWCLAQERDWAGNLSTPSPLQQFTYRGLMYCEVDSLQILRSATQLTFNWENTCHHPELVLLGFSLHELNGPGDLAGAENQVAFVQGNTAQLPWLGAQKGFFVVRSHYENPLSRRRGLLSAP